MCFSATASFGAAALLTGTTLAASKYVTDKKQRPLLAVPAIFAVQQFIEGFVWLSLTNEQFAHLKNTVVTAYMVFAEMVWPLWIPFVFLFLEQHHSRLRWLWTLQGVGILLLFPTIYYMMHFPILATVSDHHISYAPQFPPDWLLWRSIGYGLAAVVPFFITTYPRAWVMGLPNALSFFVAAYFFPGYIISVWCYFAALISITVWYVLRQNYSTQNQPS